MLGVAVSLYDKFDELELLVDILRKNWEGEYYIVVSSKHPEAKERLQDIDIDEYVSGSGIEYSPTESDSTVSSHDGWINLTSRILDSIQQTCKAAINAGCDYVLHLHADAWPLNEDKLIQIVDQLRSSKKVLAVRGDGLTFRRPDYHLGRVMDQFFIFESSYFDEIGFFNFNPLDYLPHTSIHTSLMILFLGKIGLSNIYHYSDMSSDVYWDGEKKIRPFSGVRPAVLDPEWDFLHIATDEFPGDLGKSLQADYLQKYNLTNGEHIQQYIELYGRDRAELFDELAKIERTQNRQLRLLGYRPTEFGRLYTEKEKILSQSLQQKIKSLFGNILRELYFAAFSLGFLIFHYIFRDGEPDHPYLNVKTRGFYSDAMWPVRLEQYYKDNVNLDEFPQEYQDPWFDN